MKFMLNRCKHQIRHRLASFCASAQLEQFRVGCDTTTELLIKRRVATTLAISKASELILNLGDLQCHWIRTRFTLEELPQLADLGVLVLGIRNGTCG
jgi:hypothetical protein